ncbi:MAG: VWA domain-containing protein [Deltaproteobacteria bacterium]|nr:VWA domain-containing protein [Deltaproteobacteria bacterium]
MNIAPFSPFQGTSKVLLPLAWAALLLASGLLSLAAEGQPEPSQDADGRSQVIRLLPLQGNPAQGKVVASTLTLEKSVLTVLFYLDDTQVAKRRFPPFEAKLKLASPARPQILRVEALDLDGKVIGEDQRTVNRTRRPLRVNIQSLTKDSSQVVLEVEASVPDSAQATALQAFVGKRLALAIDRPKPNEPLTLELPLGLGGDEEIVRVVLELEDGRRLEDVELLNAPGFQEEVEVHLVQVQLVALEPNGRPLNDLVLEELELTENGRKMAVSDLFRPDDISLVLGLSVDSSFSMRRIWPATRQASQLFLSSVLESQDRGFLVHFDTEVHLGHALTSDRESLLAALEDIRPMGNTSLFDSILYSLLQFDHQPGRRGLVVITDGMDSQSFSDPKQTIEIARILGVPVYVISLSSDLTGAGSREVQGLHKLTDPTGGRLFRASRMEGARRALAQIDNELRSQYVLTYYSELDPAGDLPKIAVRIPGRKGVKVKAIHGLEGFD